MTSVSKYIDIIVHIDKWDDIIKKYNNTYNAIKMKPVDVKSSTYINSRKEINNEDPELVKRLIMNILNLKLVFLRISQNIKTFLQ